MDIDTSSALISLAEAKDYLQATGNENDSAIRLFLNGVGEWVKGYLGRNLLETTYTEYYSGNGCRELLVRNYPIVSITSIHVDSLRAWDSSTAVDVSLNVQVNKPSGILTAWNYLADWSPGYSNIKIVYVAGYTLTTMPHDIRLAVKRLIDKQFRHGYTGRKLDVSTETTGDRTTSFRDDDIPKDVKSMIGRYVNNALAPNFCYAD
jgi:hypothetical protein